MRPHPTKPQLRAERTRAVQLLSDALKQINPTDKKTDYPLVALSQLGLEKGDVDENLLWPKIAVETPTQLSVCLTLAHFLPPNWYRTIKRLRTVTDLQNTTSRNPTPPQPTIMQICAASKSSFSQIRAAYIASSTIDELAKTNPKAAKALEAVKISGIVRIRPSANKALTKTQIEALNALAKNPRKSAKTTPSLPALTKDELHTIFTAEPPQRRPPRARQQTPAVRVEKLPKKAAEPRDKNQNASVRKLAELAEAHSEGHAAARRSRAVAECPYKSGQRRKAWLAGYQKARG